MLSQGVQALNALEHAQAMHQLILQTRVHFWGMHAKPALRTMIAMEAESAYPESWSGFQDQLVHCLGMLSLQTLHTLIH